MDQFENPECRHFDPRLFVFCTYFFTFPLYSERVCYVLSFHFSDGEMVFTAVIAVAPVNRFSFQLTEFCQFFHGFTIRIVGRYKTTVQVLPLHVVLIHGTNALEFEPDMLFHGLKPKCKRL